MTETLQQTDAERLQQARDALRTGDYAQAAGLYDELIDRAPQCAEYHSERGIACTQLGRYAEAEAHFVTAFNAEPANAQFFQNLSTFLISHLRQVELLDYYEQHLAHIGFDLKTYYHFASMLERCNHLERSREITNAMLEQAPQSPLSIAQHGKLLAREGEAESALSYFKANLDHLHSEPYIRSQVHFDMAKLADKLGLADDAMAYAKTANDLALQLANPPIDKMKYLKKVSFFHSLLTPEHAQHAKQLAGEASAYASPVFMIGFPRSGTTLTHQMLEGHSGITVYEERTYLNEVLSAAMQDYEQQVGRLFSQVTQEQLERYRALYWQLAGGEPEQGSIAIDKLPLNSVLMPWIQLLFPQAKIIYVQRHPFDACLSCFMQPFKLNEAMANFVSLQDSLALYAQTAQIWQKAQALMPSEVYMVRYETLTCEPEPVMRELMTFLELGWEDALLQYHARAKARFINTPSYAQVSQPLYTSSQARWRPYATYFAPYIDIMKPFLEANEYEYESE